MDLFCCYAKGTLVFLVFALVEFCTYALRASVMNSGISLLNILIAMVNRDQPGGEHEDFLIATKQQFSQANLFFNILLIKIWSSWPLVLTYINHQKFRRKNSFEQIFQYFGHIFRDKI